MKIKSVCIGYWNQKTGAFYKPMQVPAAFEKMLAEGILRKCYAAPVSIEAAVLAEREACAKVCEYLGEANRDAFAQYDCAAAIRAR